MLNSFISSFPPLLSKKVEESFRIINLAYAKYRKDICVCFNGGKDSTVLLDLIYKYHTKTEFGQKIPLKSFFMQSKDEFPEMSKYIKDVQKYWKHDLKILETSSLKDGLATMVNEYSMRAIFLGIRKSDPEGKNIQKFAATTPGWPQATRVMPLLDWEYKDIWAYIDTLNIPVCDLYKHGFTSIGSPSKTSPNPHLYDSLTKTYKHARELSNDDLERVGRK